MYFLELCGQISRKFFPTNSTLEVSVTISLLISAEMIHEEQTFALKNKFSKFIFDLNCSAHYECVYEQKSS